MNLIINEGDRCTLHKHPIGLLANEVAQIIEPLKEAFGITQFGFARLFRAGEQSYLTNHPEFTEDFINHEFYKLGFNGDPKEYLPGRYFLGALPPNKIIMHLRDRYGMGHPLMISKQYDTYCDNFFFATAYDNPGIANVYLNHMSVFEAFTDYFKERAASLIKEADKARLQYPGMLCKEVILKDMFALHNLEKLSFSTKVLFTNKESECGFYLSQCLSLKEISGRMSISPRTLEKHIARLKFKLGVKNMSSLVVAVRKYFL